MSRRGDGETGSAGSATTSIQVVQSAESNLHAETIQRFADFFPPNVRKHGRVVVNRNTNTKEARTLENAPVTSASLGAHLGATKGQPDCLGYLPGYEETTPVGTIDLDEKDFQGEAMAAARRAVMTAFTELGFKYYVERSSRGLGWHIWMWSDQPLPYPVMRAALKAIAERAGVAKVETYPKGLNPGPAGSWIITPYYQAFKDHRGLGAGTYLETEDGQAIPIWELEEWIERNPAGKIHELATSWREQSQRHDILAPDHQPQLGLEFLPDAVPSLLNAARSHAPVDRHDALSAFLNLGQRAGALAEMAAGLKDTEIYALWCRDGSRTPREWNDEVDRWAANIMSRPAGERRGIPYLREAGFDIPTLPSVPAAGGRPRIILNGRQQRDVTEEAVNALVAGNHRRKNPDLYVRAGKLVRISKHGRSITTAESLSRAMLRNELSQKADFVSIKHTKGGDVESAAMTPDWLPDNILAMRPEDLPFPELRVIATTPIYTAQGELVSTDGYHASGILLDLRGLSLPSLPSVHDALVMLREELLVDFPFADPQAGFAHALAGLLLPLVRVMIDGPTPLILINAPTQGTGKGLLMEIMALIATGDEAPLGVKPDDAELEKRVTAKLLAGERLILLDNVTRLGGQTLAAALTAQVWNGRKLGTSQSLTLPNDASWIATGNNPTLDDEMPRRIIPIRLDAGVERPEARTGFRHPYLKRWARENRPALLASCLALVEHWIAAGKPEPTRAPQLGSFEAWRHVIGGILEAAGVEGFLEGREALYAEAMDSDSAEWGRVFEAVHVQGLLDWMPARAFLDPLRECEAAPELWDNLSDVSAARRVGRALQKMVDRVIGGYRLLGNYNKNTKYWLYRIEKVEPAAEDIDL